MFSILYNKIEHKHKYFKKTFLSDPIFKCTFSNTKFYIQTETVLG